jgi:hypothetical protein
VVLLVKTAVSHQLVILPELFACGYVPNPTVWRYGESPDGPTGQWLRATARRLGIYLGAGFAEVDGDDSITALPWPRRMGNWPAASATLLYIAVPFLLFLPAYYPQLKSKEGALWGDFFRMLLFANGFGIATLPFAILGAGLYWTLGLGVYLALLGGGRWLVILMRQQEMGEARRIRLSVTVISQNTGRAARQFYPGRAASREIAIDRQIGRINAIRLAGQRP